MKTIDGMTEVTTVTEKAVDQQRVTSFRYSVVENSFFGNVEKTSNEDESVLATAGVKIDVTELTVQAVLDELESFAGSAPDLSSLTFLDFVNSVIHERS